MIASKSKEQDRKNRSNVMRCMAIALKKFDATDDKKWFEFAKQFGAVSKILATDISSRDYTADDEDLLVSEDINKRTVALEKSML